MSTTVRGAQGIILVYDITDALTMNDIYGWLDFAKNYGPEDAVKIIVGNKNDLEGGRKVTPFVGQVSAFESLLVHAVCEN